MLRQEELTGTILKAAFEVHTALGPGLLESAYDACLSYELSRRRVPFRKQVVLPVTFKGMPLRVAYRLDYVVDEKVVIEVKAVEGLQPIHEAQLFTYLRFSGFPVGLLINFNVLRLRDGVIRRVL